MAGLNVGVSSDVAASQPLPVGALSVTSRAIARVRNRTGRARMAFVGDSTIAGWGSGGVVGTGAGATPGSGGNYLRASSTPQQLSVLLSAAGIPTRADAIFGTGTTTANTVAEYVVVNPGNTFGADWGVHSSSTLGGNSLTSAATGTTSWVTRSWEYAADTFDIYYMTLAGFGTFTVTDASGTLATVDASVVVLPVGAASGGLSKVTVSRATASKLPISIQRTGVGGAIFIVGIVPYDSNSPRLEIWNMGWGGSKTSDWTLAGSNGWKAYYALTLIEQPDLWYLELGLNDRFNAVSPETYQANLNTLAARLKAGGGDLIMGKPHRPYLGNIAYNLTVAHLAAIDTVALARGAAALVDNYTPTNLGVTDYYDAVHLTGPGYAKKAAALLTAFQSLA